MDVGCEANPYEIRLYVDTISIKDAMIPSQLHVRMAYMNVLSV